MRLQFSNGCASDAISEAEEGPMQLSILGKRGPEQTGRRKKTERKGEPDRGQECKGIRRAKGLGEPAMEDKSVTVGRQGSRTESRWRICLLTRKDVTRRRKETDVRKQWVLSILYKPEKETDVAVVMSLLKPRKQSNSMNKLSSPMTSYLRHIWPNYFVDLTIVQNWRSRRSPALHA